MKLPSGVAVGVCSHTGLVRGSNEDDYLVAALPVTNGVRFLVAIADGMGGVAGGAEASRTALRALGASVLDSVSAAGDRMRDGFHSASQRVFEASTAVPALRDMGTTLTALYLESGRAAVGHVGDSRLYRVRSGRSEGLTEDHAAQAGESLLTRCIGGGQLECEIDQLAFDVEAGDRFVLVTDGVWNVVPDAEFAQLVNADEPQSVAERLVQAALKHGGPDNATVLIVDVHDPALADVSVDRDLPRHERPEPRWLWPQPVSLRQPLWPWLLLAVAGVVLLHAALQWAGIDLLQWLAAKWS